MSYELHLALAAADRVSSTSFVQSRRHSAEQQMVLVSLQADSFQGPKDDNVTVHNEHKV